VIAGSLPGTSGFDGHFSEALTNVLSQPSHFDILYSEKFIPLDAIARAARVEVNRIARERDTYSQLVVATRVDLSAKFSTPFFPNPFYAPSLLSGLTAVPSELREIVIGVDAVMDPWHFASRASGQIGSDSSLRVGYFRGRFTQLSEIRDWMQESSEPLQLVTGSPGIGKSAILGMIVCATHPVLSGPTQSLWWNHRECLPTASYENFAAIHCRDRETSVILRSIADQLSLHKTDRDWSINELTAALGDVNPVPIIVIDALDEASDPQATMAVIMALADTREGESPICRLLVGTRSGRYWPIFEPLRERARSRQTLIDLDDIASDESLRNEICGYVDDLLRTYGPYNTQRSVAARTEIAKAVSATLSSPSPDIEGPHWGEFLVAGIFANHLVKRPMIADAAEAARIGQTVPRTLPAVMELDLSSQVSSRWLLPVLTTVAYAFGSGMPLDVIASCCSIFASSETTGPTVGEVRKALNEARFYVRRDMEPDGTTLYRLFHQALVDYLQRRMALSVRSAHSGILDRFYETVEFINQSGNWEVGLTPSYVLRHAIDHAAECKRIDELVMRPEYLLQADPVTLIPHLSRARSPRARAAAAVYRTSSYLYQRTTISERRDLLTLDAVRHGSGDLADELSQAGPGPDMNWRPVWSTGGQATPSLIHILRGHVGGVTRIMCTELTDGSPAAVSAGIDGTVRVWNLITGAEHMRIQIPAGEVTALWCASLTNGDTTVVVGGHSGARVWSTRDRVAKQFLDSLGTVTAIDGTRLDGVIDVAVTGRADGSLSAWRITDGVRLHLLSRDNKAQVTAITCVRLSNGLDVVAAARTDGSADVWDLSKGMHLHRLKAHRGWIGSLAHVRIGDLDAIASAGRDGKVFVSSLADGKLLGAFTRRDWVGVLSSARLRRGKTVLIAPSGDGTAAVWEMRQEMSRPAPVYELSGHTSWVGTATCARLINGVDVAITTSGDGTSRVWDLSKGTTRRVLAGHTDSVTGAACTRLPDGAVIAVTASADSTVRVWDLESAASPGAKIGHSSLITDLACGQEIGETAIAVTTSADGTASILRVSDGSREGIIRRGQPMNAVALIQQGSLVVCTVDTSGRLMNWDLKGAALAHRSQPPGAPSKLISLDRTLIAAVPSLAGAYSSVNGARFEPVADGLQTVRAMAAGVLANGREALAAADNHTVSVWDLHSAQLLSSVPHSGIDAVAIITLRDGVDAIVAAGEDGGVNIWSLASRQLLCCLSGHHGSVVDLAFTVSPSGDAIIASAASDNTVRIWRPDAQICEQKLLFPELPKAVAFGPGGELIVAFGWEVACYRMSPPEPHQLVTR
jgi:WD40 repeat protein